MPNSSADKWWHGYMEAEGLAASIYVVMLGKALLYLMFQE